MSYTDEEIARAAGLEWPLERKYSERDDLLCDYCPYWRNDPGAVAKWLLPVVQRRLLDDEFSSLYFGVFMDSWGLYRGTIDVECGDAMLYAPTWHECVIEAIMATKPAEK
jgi:hypothetical protein